MLVDQDPLSPLLILGRLSREQGYEVVFRRTAVNRVDEPADDAIPNHQALAEELHRDAKASAELLLDGATR